MVSLEAPPPGSDPRSSPPPQSSAEIPGTSAGGGGTGQLDLNSMVVPPPLHVCVQGLAFDYQFTEADVRKVFSRYGEVLNVQVGAALYEGETAEGSGSKNTNGAGGATKSSPSASGRDGSGTGEGAAGSGAPGKKEDGEENGPACCAKVTFAAFANALAAYSDLHRKQLSGIAGAYLCVTWPGLADSGMLATLKQSTLAAQAGGQNQNQMNNNNNINNPGGMVNKSSPVGSNQMGSNQALGGQQQHNIPQLQSNQIMQGAGGAGGMPHHQPGPLTAHSGSPHLSQPSPQSLQNGFHQSTPGNNLNQGLTQSGLNALGSQSLSGGLNGSLNGMNNQNSSLNAQLGSPDSSQGGLLDGGLSQNKKFTCRLEIGIENDKEFRVRGRLT